MEKCLGGATIIVENHPGAGGVVGFTKLATSDPDGYTMGNVTVPNVITAGFTQKLAYQDDSFQLIGTMIGNSSTPSGPVRPCSALFGAYTCPRQESVFPQ